MKIYKITYKDYNDYKTRTVSANTIEKAIEDFKRYAKKNLYTSNKDIVGVEKVMEIDIHYKS